MANLNVSISNRGLHIGVSKRLGIGNFNFTPRLSGYWTWNKICTLASEVMAPSKKASKCRA